MTVKLRFGLLFVLVAALAVPGAAAADPVLVPDATTVTEAVAGDGVVAAGDDAFVVEGLRNVGGVAVTGVSATLTTSTPGVTVTQGASAYPDIAAGASAATATPFRVALADSLPCGATLDFSLSVTSSAGTVSLPFSLVTGMTGDYADYTAARPSSATPCPRCTGRRWPGCPGCGTRGPRRSPTPGAVKDVQVVIGDLSDHDTSHLEIALIAPDGTQTTLVDHRGAPGGRSARRAWRATLPRRWAARHPPSRAASGPTATSAPSSGPPPAAPGSSWSRPTPRPTSAA